MRENWTDRMVEHFGEEIGEEGKVLSLTTFGKRSNGVSYKTYSNRDKLMFYPQDRGII